MKKIKLLIATTIAYSLTSVALASGASTYPNQPIRLILPFAAKGSTDILVRIIADSLGKELGQPILVENIGGEGGKTGTLEALRSLPDGYTLISTTISSLITNTVYNKNVGYDALKDFSHISNIADVPGALLVRKDFPANNYKEFEAIVKGSRGKFMYASSGQGGIQHFLMEYYKSITKTNISHIPYRGAGPAVKDTVAGKVDMVFDNYTSSDAFVKSGDLKPIAVAGPKRIPAIPNVPTFKELGLDKVNLYTFYGISAPAGLDPEIANKISKAMIKVINNPEIKRKIEEVGAIPNPNTPQEYTKMFEREFLTYSTIVKNTNLKAK